MKSLIKKVQKRDGSFSDFDQSKITDAIFKATEAAGAPDPQFSQEASDRVVSRLNSVFENKAPTVEQIQDLVISELLRQNKKVAHVYISYRHKRSELREKKNVLFGVYDDLKLDLNSIKVLASRYLQRDMNGKVIETPRQMFRRVARHIASVDSAYGQDKKKSEKAFYDMMCNLEFLPNSPTLMNAGTRLDQLSACFVLPIEDSLESIFDTLKYAALTHQCLIGDTLVMTDSGFVKIKDVNLGSKIAADDGTYAVSAVYNNGIQKTYRVKTKHGFEIIGTSEHKFICIDSDGEFKWKKVGDLNSGDWVVLRHSIWLGNDNSLPAFDYKPKEGGNKTSFKAIVYALPKIMTPELAELMGFYIGDGSKHRDGIRFTVSEKEKDIIDRLTFLSTFVLGKKPTISKAKHGVYEVALLSQHIKQWFDYLGVTKPSSRTVKYPNIFLRTSEDVVTAFIRGLFSADGCVRTNGYITYSCASKEFISVLQNVLLHLGIPTRLGHIKSTDVYQLHVCTKTGFINFKNKIGFSSKFKQARLNNVHSDQIFVVKEPIPNQQGQVIEWYNSLPRGHKIRYRGLLDHIIYNKMPDNLTRQKAQQIRLLSETEIVPSFIPALLQLPFLYTQISEIEYAGEKEVYDLTVPNKHAYLANGFISHNSGGGTGFSFSRLRPRGDVVRSTMSVASGPVSFMRIYDAMTETIKQGGRRRGANMGILRCDHPDIIEFINSKRNGGLSNFNISVAATDKFMDAVKEDDEYELVNPKSGEASSVVSAREVFGQIVQRAWENGDPGMIFIDRMNKTHPLRKIGEIEATNPCGEQPLLPYESCNLGSINLTKFIRPDGSDFDWDRLEGAVRNAVHFLDNVIDANKIPIKQTEQVTRANRKIGLGIMGWAEALIMLNMKYDSREALALAEKLMKFIKQESYLSSSELASKRGSYPNFKFAVYSSKLKRLRNATLNTIAPTGSLSIIAGVSSGIEPLFAVAYYREVLEKVKLIEINKLFHTISIDRGFYSRALIESISRGFSIQKMKEIPKDVRELFVTSYDIDPVWHVRMQAAFQKHVDNAVSKTVNLSSDATAEDIKEIYLKAYESGAKGITVYRYGSRPEQVIYIGKPGKVTVGSEFAGSCPSGSCVF